MPVTDSNLTRPFRESRLEDGPKALRAEMAEYGYVFFRGLVPADNVLDLRRDILTLCAEAGWIDMSRDLMDGIAAPGQTPTQEGRPEYMAVYRKILKETPRFQSFPLHPRLIEAAAVLLDAVPEDVLLHPRRIGRITFPKNEDATTPAHQDHFYIRGTTDTYSCWAPLGECPIALGGLVIAPGSHRGGFHEHNVKFPAAIGGRGVPTDDILEWHTSDYGVGDAVFFHSFTIHKALPNRTPDRLRLSTDNRYQRRGEDIDPTSLLTHFNL